MNSVRLAAFSLLDYIASSKRSRCDLFMQFSLTGVNANRDMRGRGAQHSKVKFRNRAYEKAAGKIPAALCFAVFTARRYFLAATASDIIL